MFELDPNRPVWIVKKSGNIAVWPRGGQFSGPLVVPNAVYEVKGHPLDAETHSPLAVSAASSASSPFGAYAFPTHKNPMPSQLVHPHPHPHPPKKRRRGGARQLLSFP